MTVPSTVWAHQANSNPAVDARNALAALYGVPYASVTTGAQITTAGGGSGVVPAAACLAVTQHGTPNMSVDVGAGRCVIRGSEATNQGVYYGHNTASLNVTNAIYPDTTVAAIASDATNPRKMLVVARIRDSQYSGASDDFDIVAYIGAAAGSPSDPTIPDNVLVLARVLIGANASSIVTADITDLRTYATALGGVHVCTSTTRPTGASLYEGLFIYETDTNKVYSYDGTNWVPPKNVSGGT